MAGIGWQSVRPLLVSEIRVPCLHGLAVSFLCLANIKALTQEDSVNQSLAQFETGQ